MLPLPYEQAPGASGDRRANRREAEAHFRRAQRGAIGRDRRRLRHAPSRASDRPATGSRSPCRRACCTARRPFAPRRPAPRRARAPPSPDRPRPASGRGSMRNSTWPSWTKSPSLNKTSSSDAAHLRRHGDGLHRLDDAAREDVHRRVDPRHRRDAHRRGGRRFLRRGALAARQRCDRDRGERRCASCRFVRLHRSVTAHGVPKRKFGRPARSSEPVSCASCASAVRHSQRA